MILGKTNHPVEIKQIPLRSWPLRAEIEVALNTCLKDDGTLDEEKAQIIKEFFEKISYPNSAEVTEINKNESDDKTVDEESLDTENKNEESKDKSEAESDEDKPQTDEKERLKHYRPEHEKTFLGKSLLSDIHMDSIVFFSEKEYTPGQTVTLEIINARPFCLHLKVDNVMNFSRNSKVITPNKMGFRILGTFLFPFEQQKNDLRNFLEKIEPEILATERAKKKEKDEKSPDNALDKAEQESEESTDIEASDSAET